MEVLSKRIEQFLSVSYGYGFGSGDGNGYGFGFGSGDGDGIGFGSGFGSGDGDGIGNGDGYGYGYGITEINGMKVWDVDNTPTIITNIKGNIAQGYTIRHNVELVPCYVAKVGNYFGHGETTHEALQAAQEKYDENRPLSERIADTVKKYPTLDTIVPHKELYALHHTLTGSCKYGRDEFASLHGLDPDKGEMTMHEFINLTIDAYGSDAIKKLLHAYTDE